MEEQIAPGQPSDSTRRRVLISAYACGPVSEPEARAGWEIVRAAARDHDVWVITRPRFAPAIEAAFAADPDLAARVHVEYLDLSARAVRLKKTPGSLYWYYPLWQRAVGRRARALHAELRFDVAHHATFANDWMPAGVASLSNVPFVWGPVGGASRVPLMRLARWLGMRGVLTEAVRAVITGAIRRLLGETAARDADLVIAQNPDVARHFARRGAPTVVEPNAALEALPVRAAQIRPRSAVFAARLLAWKGGALAIDTIAHPAAAGWTLDVYGEGYEARRLRRRVAQLGLGERVTFHGHRPRAEVLAAIAGADAFLFPSMHDQAGWVVAEASSIGCPVVCLPLGGPPVLAQPNDHVAALSGDIVGNLARRLGDAARAGGTPTDRWSVARLPDTVAGWYQRAIEQRTARAERPLRVLESFRAPKATTNPYITQLYDTLRARDDLAVRAFDNRVALFGRYDVVHLHWPELLMGGHNWRGRTVRRLLTAATILRWRLTRTPLVRTVHNLERPTNINRIDHFLLDRIDALTVLDIHLNESTPPRGSIRSVLLPHGHYRDWYPRAAATDTVPGRIGYVGLIRRYKGVESLIESFAGIDDERMSLHIAGKPSTADLGDALRSLAHGDGRITIDDRFLDDDEFVRAITAAELIVLPYRHMHNSGTALAALSLGTPVLVPDNRVNRALAAEVGPEWVQLFHGTLTTDALQRAWRAVRSLTGEPDLSAREWPASARAHAEAFRAAVVAADGGV